MKRIRTFLIHYIYGVISASWQAGVRAVKLSGGLTIGAVAAPKLLSQPTLSEIAAIFAAAVFWEAIDYFNDNPLPAQLPAEISATRNPPAAS